MANIRKRGDRWQAEVRVKGNGRTKSFTSKAEAQRWALEFEHQLGRNPGVILARSLGEAMQRYAKEISPSKKGAQWEIVRLKKLERDPIAHIQLADLRADDFASWMQRQTIGNASINRELTLIASVLRVARVQWKWMLDNPMADVRRPKQPPSRDRLLSPNEIKRILSALQYDEDAPVISARQEIAVTMLLALETAMRRGEIYSLDWSNVHLKRKFLTLPDTKNGTRRDVPLTPRAIELLRKLKPKDAGKVIHGSQISADTIFRGAVKLAGITGLTFHDTRHTAITNLARKLDVLDLARMVGHRDLRSLQVYYNATAEDIAKRLAS